MRLDKYLVEEGYFESRNRALDAVKSGRVKVDGRAAKPSLKVNSESVVEVENEKFYVSRAARKLESFLQEHPVEIRGARVLDIGSSTGGFAQILIENGAAELHCVDVGREQLHASLRSEKSLHLHEETDIRDFADERGFDLISCDVSFISILQIIDSIDRLAGDAADLIILYKPQFEVGRETRRDSRGVVLDMDAVERKREEFEKSAAQMGWELVVRSESKLPGREGNREYFYHFLKKGNP